jgi:hypothetical protein
MLLVLFQPKLIIIFSPSNLEDEKIKNPVDPVKKMGNNYFFYPLINIL